MGSYRPFLEQLLQPLPALLLCKLLEELEDELRELEGLQARVSLTLARLRLLLELEAGRSSGVGIDGP